MIKFSPNSQITDSTNSTMAAAFLGVSLATLRRYRKCGVLPAFALPSRNSGKVIWRYRYIDLLILCQRHLIRRHLWDPLVEEELPVSIVARILGITEHSVWQAKYRGQLKDYLPESISAYMTRVFPLRKKNKTKKTKRRLIHLKGTQFSCSKKNYF
jgi:hypothetical protein